MSQLGDSNLLVQARSALLDALEALADHRDAVVLVGAQAIYLHTGAAEVALAEATKDSDLAVDTRHLASDPLIESAMAAAGFYLDPINPQPGAWRSPLGVPVDLMVPEALAGTGGRRAVRVPPHDKNFARRTVGLEAAIIDHAPTLITALAEDDSRRHMVNLAGPAALLVAKMHKIYERREDLKRLNAKDAHDIYRLLVAIDTEVLAVGMSRLLANSLSGEVTHAAVEYMGILFAAGPTALGCLKAGEAERLIGDPVAVANASHFLAVDLLTAL